MPLGSDCNSPLKASQSMNSHGFSNTASQTVASSLKEADALRGTTTAQTDALKDAGKATDAVKVDEEDDGWTSDGSGVFNPHLL